MMGRYSQLRQFIKLENCGKWKREIGVGVRELTENSLRRNDAVEELCEEQGRSDASSLMSDAPRFAGCYRWQPLVLLDYRDGAS